MLAEERKEAGGGPDLGGDAGHISASLEIFNASEDDRPTGTTPANPEGVEHHGYTIGRIEAEIQIWRDKYIVSNAKMNQTDPWCDGENDTSPWRNVLEGVARSHHVRLIQHPIEHEPNAPLGSPPAKPIKSIVKAKQHPDWLRENGLRAAFVKELHRTFTNVFEGQPGPTLVYVSAKHRDEARRLYGYGKIHTKCAVVPMKWKKDKNGDTTECGARITVGDTVAAGKAPETFAPNGIPASRRVLTQAAVTMRAKLRPDDVPGAYYNGHPDGPEVPGGRGLYMFIPDGWEEFGYHKKDPTTGEMMLIWVPGNCPGRQEAGAGWNAENSKFMTSVGFQKSIVDRQLF